MVALAVVVLVAIVAAGSAAAHSFLVRTTPAPGARLDRAPAEVVLDFSEALATPPTATLRTGERQTIAELTFDLNGSGTRARADVPELGRGVFLVAWRVVAEDGHTSEGEFAFAVGVKPPAVATTTTGGHVDWSGAVAGAALLGGLALAVGGQASQRWLLPLGEPAPPVRAAIAIALAAALSRTLLTVDDLGIGWPPGEWGHLAESRPGRFDLALLALLAVAALGARRPKRPLAMPALVAAAIVIAAAGHAGDASWWARPATSAHIVVAGAWLGALWHLALVARHQGDRPATLLRVGARRYSRYATVTALGTILLGSVNAFAQVDRPSQLLDTTYGRILVIKIALVATALAVALGARLKALPAVGPRTGVLARLTSIEAIVLITVVGASAVLAATAPPGVATSFILGPPPVPDQATWTADLAGNSMVLAAAAPDLLRVTVYIPGGQPPVAANMQIDGTEPDGSGFDIDARSCGPGCATIAHRWQQGETTLTVTVTGTGYADGTAHLTVHWPPSPNDPELLERAVAATRAAPRLDIVETVSSGPGAVSGPYPITVDGRTYIASEPYAAGADSVRRLPDDGANRVITFVIPGSNVWQQLAIDADDRIVRETLVDPGHRIDRTITYP